MARKRNINARVVGARVCMTLWLTFAWVLLWGTVELGTIVAGLLVSIGVMVLMPLPRVPVEGLLRPVSTIWLVIMVGYYLVRSSVIVAWQSVRPRPLPKSAVLRAPMRLKSDFSLALAVNSLNLMPGGIVVRVDPVARYVYIHVLDTGTEKAVEAFRKQTAHVEKLYQRAFERPEDWRPSPEHYWAPADSAPEAPVDAPAGRGQAGQLGQTSQVRQTSQAGQAGQGATSGNPVDGRAVDENSGPAAEQEGSS